MTNPTHRTIRLLAGLILGLTAVTLRAEKPAPSLEDRLSRLEGAIARIEAKLNDTVSADELAPTLKEYSDLTKALGWDGKSPLTAVKPAGKEKTLSLGGFVHANFESGTTAPDARFAGLNNRFLLRRARLFATGTFAEDFSFKLESDFGNNSIAAKTGLSGQLTDAYLSWTKLPSASLRLGQFKTPFGYEQLLADTKLYTIERSLPNDSLTVSRQIGGMLYGDIADKRVSYSLAAYNGTGVNVSSNDNQKFMWVGRVTGVALDTKVGDKKLKITAGADYFTTEDKGTFTGRREGESFDVQGVYGPAELQAEWLQNDKHPTTGLATTARGWALLGACFVTPKWQGVVRYESYDSNTATAATTTTLWTYGVNYYLKGDDLKLSLDYLVGKQPVPAPQGERLIARLQVMF
jgi:phosphate-selective porin